MKIKKNKNILTESVKLEESRDPLDDFIDGFANWDDEEESPKADAKKSEPTPKMDEPVEIDKTSELKDAVKNDCEAQTGNIPSKAVVDKIVDEIQYADNYFDGNLFAPIGSANDLTEILDDSLAAALANRAMQGALKSSSARESAFSRNNVLVTGLPGSGKTAIVKAWAKARGLNLKAVNAKNNDLELAINGAIMRDTTVTNKNQIVQAYSKYLAPLERKNSVLFLDELNRQTDDQIRASLLTLTGEHCIYSDDVDPDDVNPTEGDGDGYHFFKNLLFCIACINPSVPQDLGAAALNDAERSRYRNKIEYDSSKKDAAAYFKWHYTNLIKELDPNNPMYVMAYKTYYLRRDIALYITEHKLFKFDTRDDLQDLYTNQKTMLNQRLLSDQIDGLELKDRQGRNMKQQLLKWLGTDSANPNTPGDDFANLLDKDKQMLITILNSYSAPDDTEIEVPNMKKQAPKKEEPKAEKDDLIDHNDETDSEMFNGGEFEEERPEISDDELDNSMNNKNSASSYISKVTGTMNSKLDSLFNKK